MRIYSLKVRDDALKDPGYAVVQHGGFDKIDLSAMERLYARCPERNRNGLEGETSEKFAGD